MLAANGSVGGNGGVHIAVNFFGLAEELVGELIRTIGIGVREWNKNQFTQYLLRSWEEIVGEALRGVGGAVGGERREVSFIGYLLG